MKRWTVAAGALLLASSLSAATVDEWFESRRVEALDQLVIANEELPRFLAERMEDARITETEYDELRVYAKHLDRLGSDLDLQYQRPQETEAVNSIDGEFINSMFAVSYFGKSEKREALQDYFTNQGTNLSSIHPTWSKPERNVRRGATFFGISCLGLCAFVGYSVRRGDYASGEIP